MRTEAVLQLEEYVRQHRLQEALVELRRQTRCSSQEGRLFLSDLARPGSSWDDLARRYPNVVAPLAGDPPPTVLRALQSQRFALLRLLRRGRKLQALRLVQDEVGVEQAQARLICNALGQRLRHWDQVLARYTAPPKDFWQEWPPAPEPPPEVSMVVLPDRFDSLLFEDLLKRDIRSCVMFVRRCGGCSGEVAQQFVDTYEELQEVQTQRIWVEMSRRFTALLANLGRDPNPIWLVMLKNRREELLNLVDGGRKLQAMALVEEVCKGSSAEIRRFLQALGSGESWDATLEKFRKGFTWGVEAPPAAALPVAPAPVPKKAPPKVTPAKPPPPAPPKSLSDFAPTLQKLLSLADRGSKDQVREILRELEASGVDRDWLTGQAPWLEKLLPPAPLSDRVDDLVPVLRQLEDFRTTGKLPAALRPAVVVAAVVEQVVEQVAEKLGLSVNIPDIVLQPPPAPAAPVLEGPAPPANDHEEILADLERFAHSHSFSDLEGPLDKLLQSGWTEHMLRERVPKLAKLLPDGHMSLAGLKALKERWSHPGIALVRELHADLPEMLGEEKTHKLVALLPKLTEAVKRGKMARASQYLMQELRLGPLDVGELLAALAKKVV